MPPKKANEPSKKTVDKQKQKILEDKTFGLKNKKGAKTQKYIQQVEKQVVFGNKSAKEQAKLKDEKVSKKEEKLKEIDELNSLFKPVIEMQKVAQGVDPKSVLCVFHKQGMCTKGAKCKFSHDLNLARKAEKRSMYDDGSGAVMDENGDGEMTGGAAGGGAMDTWDQTKLEDVVNMKHGASNKGLPPSTIICKHFLDAVENNVYGWFWQCPNGGERCHYRHALPAGFVLKKDKKKMDEQAETITLEELIENERCALEHSAAQTRVTLESFLRWKKKKRAEKRKRDEAELEKKKSQFKQGKTFGISGREMFEFNPDLVDDGENDDEGGCVDTRLRDNDTDDEADNVEGTSSRVGGEGASGAAHVREIKLTDFDNYDYDAIDDNDIVITTTTVCDERVIISRGETQHQGEEGDVACGGVEIDEDLFCEDDDADDEDDDDVTEQLDNMHLNGCVERQESDS